MSFHSLMFGWEYPPLHSGGLGVACQGLVRGLLKHGARVTLVLPNNVKEDDERVDTRGPAAHEHIDIRYVRSALDPYDGETEYMERIASMGIAEPINLYGPNMGEAVEHFTAMSVQRTKDVQPDVIHCHDWMTYEAGARAATHHRVPLVAHIHATELDRTDFHPNAWIADKERKGLLQADKIIAVSNYTKNILVNHYGIAADKITVIHNGHDATSDEQSSADKPLPTKRAPLILFLGRLTVQKNPAQFLEVANVVHGMRPDVQFIMAGDGGMLPELIDRTCALKLTDCVTFTGKVNREEVDKLYRAANCFIMPSLSEPFGLVALEAIANGVPVIMSKQSGAAEVVDHCFKVDFWDTDRFADCILTILREETLASQLRSEASNVLKRLSWKNQASHVLSLYQELAPR